VKPKQAPVKSAAAVKSKTAVKGKSSTQIVKTKVIKRESGGVEKLRVVNRISVPGNPERKLNSKGLRIPQYAYMKAPGTQHDFQVGDSVEVYCDHEKNRERVRGWIGGIVVQVDNKMVAVQFRSNVFLTDGWMVPDRILWYPLMSEHIRPFGSKKNQKRDEKVLPPDY
jgi:hypothetical protein